MESDLLSVRTNTAAMKAATAVTMAQRSIETSMERLSTGKRLNSAADDAAGVAISSRLTASLRGTNQSIRNALDAQALLDTAEGALQETEALLQRIRELAVQAASDTNSSTDRAALDAEKTQLIAEIDRIAGTTSWAGQKLLDGTFTNKNFQVGGGTMAVDLLTVSSQSNLSDNLGLTTFNPATPQFTSAVPTNTAPENVGTEFGINTYENLAQQNPKISKLADGGFVVVWESWNQQGNSNLGIYAQRYNANGDKNGAEFKVSDDGQRQERPNVTGLSGGGFVVSWDDGNYPDPLFSVYNSSGDLVVDSQNVPVGASSSADVRGINVIALSDNNFAISWNTKESGTLNSYTFAQLYNSAGVALSDIFKVNTSTGTIISNTSSRLVDLKSGGFLAVWEAGGPTYLKYAQTFDATGNKVSDETQLPGSGLGNGMLISELSNGQYVSVYYKSINGDGYGTGPIYATLMDSSLNAIGSEFQINDFSGVLQSLGHITPLDDGGFVVAWSEAGGKGQRFDASGAKIGAEFSIGSSGAATLSNGNFVSIKVATDSSETGVFGQLHSTADLVTTPAKDAETIFHVDFLSAANSVASIDLISTAIQTLNSRKASLGALSNRLDHIVANNTNIATNIAKSISRIEDADFAAETTNLAKQQILQQASIAMLAQANASKQNILTLLQG